MSMFRLAVNFTALDSVRKKMGAPLVRWESGYTNQTELEDRRVTFVLNSQEEMIENIGVRDDKILIDKKDNSVVVLYIKDHSNSEYELKEDPSVGKKVHLTWCTTLERMTKADRFDRYVATKETSGEFEVDFNHYYTGESGTLRVPLHVCVYCLRALGISKDQKGNYDFQHHMERYSDSPMFKRSTRYTDKNAPKNVYPNNWDELSRKYRESQSWVCEDCGVDLKDHPSFLDTHHVNGLKNDCRPDNLRALCKICHHKLHTHYPPTRRAVQVIQSLRGSN